MRKPTVENVDKWTDHYKSMAEGKFPLEDMYILNQQGRGLGLNKRGKIIYKIQKSPAKFTSPPIISPLAQGINQAESMVKSKGRIKRSSRKKKTHSKRINCRSRKKKLLRKRTGGKKEQLEKERQISLDNGFNAYRRFSSVFCSSS